MLVRKDGFVSEKKKEDKTKGGQQWVRVSGPDLCERKKINAKENFNRKESPEFVIACEKVGIKPTIRQASKFNRKFGAAYKNFQGIEMNGYVYPNV